MTLREPPRLLPNLWKWTLASGVLAVILRNKGCRDENRNALPCQHQDAQPVSLLVSTLSPRFPAPARHGCGQADQA